MILIADSSSTSTEWVVLDGSQVIETATTCGLNPYIMTRREISHAIRLALPESFFKRKYSHLFFYGTGCNGANRKRILELSLTAQFKTTVTIESDRMAAARAALQSRAGLVCILSTCSKSCHYDGKEVVRSVSSCGFILGDEGSNAYLGRQLVADIIKGIAPEEISQRFYEKYDTDADTLIERIYTDPHPMTILADYSGFLSDNIDEPYCSQLVYDGFINFFRRNIVFYDYRSLPVSFVGSTGYRFRPILEDACAEFGVKISKVLSSSMPGLIEYHINHDLVTA